MRTRLLKTKDVVRCAVVKAEVGEAAGTSLVLKTTAVKAERPNLAARRANFLGEVEGRVRIDVLTDHIVRVRYAEGDRVPENSTPMVTGQFAGPSHLEVDLSRIQTDSPAPVTQVFPRWPVTGPHARLKSGNPRPGPSQVASFCI